jgi:hypothetical protein
MDTHRIEEAALIGATKPSGSILNHLRLALLDATRKLDSDLFRLHGLWQIALRFQPNADERMFSYDVLLAQTSREGCCYVYGDLPSTLPTVIGADSRTLVTGNRSLDIAILDAAYGALEPQASETQCIVGSSCRKAHLRAEFIANEVDRLLIGLPAGKLSRIAVVGTIGTLISVLQSRHYEVVTTDLDPTLIHTRIHGVVVQDGRTETHKIVAEADIAVVTGMTLASGTLDDILAVASRANTPIILVAETGSWFAPKYVAEFGVDVVFAEPFPFYIFSGSSELRIYRKRERR